MVLGSLPELNDEARSVRAVPYPRIPLPDFRQDVFPNEPSPIPEPLKNGRDSANSIEIRLRLAQALGVVGADLGQALKFGLRDSQIGPRVSRVFPSPEPEQEKTASAQASEPPRRPLPEPISHCGPLDLRPTVIPRAGFREEQRLSVRV